MKLLKSISFVSFQSDIMAPPGLTTQGSNIIVSRLLKLYEPSNGHIDFELKSAGSSIMMCSGAHTGRVRVAESMAPVFGNIDGTMGAFCLTAAICDCLGKGLFIGGVGGA